MTADCLVWVVPCFEEAARLDRAAWLTLADAAPDTRLQFVDDGSRDGTLAVLEELAGQRPEKIEVVALPENRGKAEAVRHGMRRALDAQAGILGYVDADLATPTAELARLARLMRDGDYDMLMGSRVQLLGRAIARSHVRHYLGRMFATIASLSLGLPVYDTQCGAKLLRPTPALAAALATPFVSRWAFDVELLDRLLHPPVGIAPVKPGRIREEPLAVWTDVPGSKVRPLAALQGGLDLLRIAIKTGRR
jgi:dolichyl-phosphate beta-glucosyltransferase